MTKQENLKEGENTRLKLQVTPGNPKFQNLSNQRDYILKRGGEG